VWAVGHNLEPRPRPRPTWTHGAPTRRPGTRNYAKNEKRENPRSGASRKMPRLPVQNTFGTYLCVHYNRQTIWMPLLPRLQLHWHCRFHFRFLLPLGPTMLLLSSRTAAAATVATGDLWRAKPREAAAATAPAATTATSNTNSNALHRQFNNSSNSNINMASKPATATARVTVIKDFEYLIMKMSEANGFLLRKRERERWPNDRDGHNLRQDSFGSVWVRGCCWLLLPGVFLCHSCC